MKESFLIYKAFYAPIEELSNEDLGQLFRAIFQYQINGVEPTNTSRIYMAFQFFKNQFRLDSEKYSKVVNRNKTNGLKGGRPITQTNPKNPVGFTKPKKADNDNDNVLSKDNNNNETPTIEIFLNYAKTLEIYKPNLDYAIKSKYQAWIDNGWKDGNGKIIKNWKTTLRNTMPYLKAIEQPREETDQEYKVRMLRERGFAV